jgi:hypothetical protein
MTYRRAELLRALFADIGVVALPWLGYPPYATASHVVEIPLVQSVQR